MSVSAAPRPALAIVVPVLHDTDALAALLQEPREAGDEWIVVNGDTGDHSLDPLRQSHGDICWVDSERGRGRQIAAGVARATADWVLILHADTRLAPGWRGQVTDVASQASYDWGCFRLRLDTGAWQARLIERVVRLRVRLFRLPYGDQAMFVRRATLDAVGGIPRLPLMEDVALARRLGRVGPPFRSGVVAVTSARRWERDGWWSRSARNLWLLTQYVLGVPPERLAAAYDGTKTC